MATYSAGASIKESGSLKRSTDGTTSKTLGANEYALVTFIMTASARVEGISSGSESYEEGDASTSTLATLAGLSSNQFIVGGGITFSITRGSGRFDLTIDDSIVFRAANYTSTYISAQYVVFE